MASQRAIQTAGWIESDLAGLSGAKGLNMRLRVVLCAFCLVVFSPSAHAKRSAETSVSRVYLHKGWMLQTSAKVDAGGEVLSKLGFQPRGWHSASVPSTVVGALVKDGTYPDPGFGMNMRQLPGTDYKIGTNSSDSPMDPKSPFAVPWWYRKTFRVPANYAGKTIWLNFAAINYRANIWLNGKKIADEKDVAGAWRTYEFDVTKIAHPGFENVLAVEVFTAKEYDLAISFVNWNPNPPDRSMGLFREVSLSASGPVAVRFPAVISHLDLPRTDQAHLTVTAELKNATDRAVKGTLLGRIEGIEFGQEIELGALEIRDVTFDPGKFPQLNFTNPRLWWPAQVGTPNLYTVHLEFDTDGTVSDAADSHFGIREITSELNDVDGRVFSVNGKKILIRGGGWNVDLLLRPDSQRMRDEFRYVADMGLNTIRLEGMLEPDEFFDLADRGGILIMAGWSCSMWEHWDKWTPEHYAIAKASERSQMLRLRGHPSLLMWLNGSDNPPPADVEKMYLAVERESLWPNPIVSSATAEPTQVTGKSGMKMPGPYDWVAPEYWLEDHKSGGAFGFNTETGPGPAIPPIESLRRMFPKEHLWPIDDWWNYRTAGEGFKDIQVFSNIHVFTEALDARYGRANNVEDFAFKSQIMNFESIRAMFEGYSRNKYTSAGVIQWMINSAWPSLVRQLYDYYLRPGGGYFGAKRALEPLHPIYSYDDRSIWVVSSLYKDVKGLRLIAKVYNLDMSEKFSDQVAIDVPADSTNKVLTLPAIDGLSSVYFLRLALEDGKGEIRGSNFYWLSTHPESLDWEHATWYFTPTVSYANFTALNQLPKVILTVDSRTEQQGEEQQTHVVVENPSRSLAFFLRLKVNSCTNGDEILPVVWQDNYFSLLPGEKREVTAIYRVHDHAPVNVEVGGWNAAQFRTPCGK